MICFITKIFFSCKYKNELLLVRQTRICAKSKKTNTIIVEGKKKLLSIILKKDVIREEGNN